jgi:hypothetical protein
VSDCVRGDYGQRLHRSCVTGGASARGVYSSLHASWYGVMETAIRHTSEAQVSAEAWTEAIAAAMESNDIECVPGAYRSKLSGGRALRFVGRTRSAYTIGARPGSLRWETMGAGKHDTVVRVDGRIDFGCTPPFRNVPALVEEGFEEQIRLMQGGNPRVGAHYQVALNCLKTCIGSPCCDVMLMLALTMAASSETPEVTPSGQGFTAAIKKKDPKLLAANLITRMLWYLQPNSFPWKEDLSSAVMGIPEMTKKMGRRLL